VIVALPVMLLTQLVVALLATTVYVPDAVCSPKLKADQVTHTAKPTGLLPRYNW
jgi:hypothetical protein